MKIDNPTLLEAQFIAAQVKPDQALEVDDFAEAGDPFVYYCGECARTGAVARYVEQYPVFSLARLFDNVGRVRSVEVVPLLRIPEAAWNNACFGCDWAIGRHITEAREKGVVA